MNNEALRALAAAVRVDQVKKSKPKPRPAKISAVELAAANENYGGAKAHFHDAGYAFERGCQKLKGLLAPDKQHWRECAGGLRMSMLF